jgi:hypothetical protein
MVAELVHPQFKRGLGNSIATVLPVQRLIRENPMSLIGGNNILKFDS